MNLFILSLIQKEIAQAMMDKHVNKILLEAVQMLCTAKRVLDPDDPINDSLYRMAHKNHPVSIWCRESRENFEWTLELIEELHIEWKFRYKHPESKVHKSYEVAMLLKKHMPTNFPSTGLTPFAQCVPEEYKSPCPVMSYRAYYMSPDKQKIATWDKGRSRPLWFQEIITIE
jgi:hypothetical protein